MIVSGPFQDVLRGVGRNSLDLPVAGFAALAVAFLAFAAPNDLLSGLIDSTGLPALVPAAEPPLGLKARLGVGIIVAAAVFASIFFLLRWLDRPRHASAAFEGPRVRRRDVHPDAPVCRPISAARDLGEPRAQERRAETPLWLAPADAVPAEPARPAPAETVPTSAAHPVSEPKPSSLPELMARLEHGLARRSSRKAAVPARAAEPLNADDRLQSAIDSLQRLAGQAD